MAVRAEVSVVSATAANSMRSFSKRPVISCGEVLRVGSRTAVATGQDFAVVHQALQHQLGGLCGRLDQYFFGFLLGADALGKMCGNAFL